jgi:hypothetical protein
MRQERDMKDKPTDLMKHRDKNMTLVCTAQNCGSVRFSLRRDGEIECHACGWGTGFRWDGECAKARDPHQIMDELVEESQKLGLYDKARGDV